MSTTSNKESFLTAEYLRSQLSYDPDNGDFWWITRNGSRRSDIPAGNTTHYGYRQIGIRIGGKDFRFQSHRLAWLYVHGVWPKLHLDHIDRNPSNNRIKNRREATELQNSRNRKKTEKCSSRYIGVSWYKAGKKWRSWIRIDGKLLLIGSYASEADAALAYNKAALARDPNFHNLNVVIQPKSA